MVGRNMDGPTRDQLLKFMEEKTRIEQEIQELQLVLENNHVGMRDELVDGEGYPRSDIDVYQVRHARHRILCLNNDHKEIMRQIERGLHAVHADIRGSQGEGPSNVQAMDTTILNGHSTGHSIYNGHSNGHISNRHISNGVDLVVEGTREMLVNDRAIAKVNFVSAGSPAEQAGIQVEDEILQFGSVNATNFTALTQIAHVVQHSVGSRVEVVVRRGGAGAVRLALSPGAWAGRGLLGCNILPI